MSLVRSCIKTRGNNSTFEECAHNYEGKRRISGHAESQSGTTFLQFIEWYVLRYKVNNGGSANFMFEQKDILSGNTVYDVP
jgi:hypothetical protein